MKLTTPEQALELARRRGLRPITWGEPEYTAAPPRASAAWKVLRAKLIGLLHNRRPYPNKNEEAFFQLATKSGWLPLRQGWPDYLCFDDQTGTPIAVEIKPRKPNGDLYLLDVEQGIIMDLLQAHGVDCYVSDGETTEAYDRDRHVADTSRNTSRGRAQWLNKVAAR